MATSRSESEGRRSRRSSSQNSNNIVVLVIALCALGFVATNSVSILQGAPKGPNDQRNAAIIAGSQEAQDKADLVSIANTVEKFEDAIEDIARRNPGSEKLAMLNDVLEFAGDVLDDAADPLQSSMTPRWALLLKWIIPSNENLLVWAVIVSITFAMLSVCLRRFKGDDQGGDDDLIPRGSGSKEIATDSPWFQGDRRSAARDDLNPRGSGSKEIATDSPWFQGDRRSAARPWFRGDRPIFLIDEERQLVRKIFELLDFDEDGKIEQSEFVHFVEFAKDAAQTYHLWDAGDADQKPSGPHEDDDGTISLDSLMSFMNSIKVQIHEHPDWNLRKGPGHRSQSTVEDRFRAELERLYDNAMEANAKMVKENVAAEEKKIQELADARTCVATEEVKPSTKRNQAPTHFSPELQRKWLNANENVRAKLEDENLSKEAQDIHGGR